MQQLFKIESWKPASVAVNAGLILFLCQDFLTLEEARFRIKHFTASQCSQILKSVMLRFKFESLEIKI